jgi:hypothetical protein
MKLETALTRIPPPGKGTGCHQFLMVCANIAIREGLEEDEAVSKIHAAVPHGSRAVSEKEVRDTVRKAIGDKLHGRGRRPSHGNKLKSLRMTTPGMLDKFLHPETITLQHLQEASPIVFDPKDSEEQAVATLYHLFKPEDQIFIGKNMSNGKDAICTRDDWIEGLKKAGPDHYPPHIIWNPLTGRHAKTSDGKDSLRCDRAVADFRYTLVEFDDLDFDTQLRFWAGCRLPVAALVFSGSKSVHGVVKISSVKTLDDWRHQVQQLLYKQWLAPLGVDPACSNASRLSRMPGAWREGKDGGAYQRLLYLNPNATPMNLEI